MADAHECDGCYGRDECHTDAGWTDDEGVNSERTVWS